MSDTSNGLIGNENEDAFDILNIFNEQASSSELGAGARKSTSYHDRPSIVKIIMEILLRSSCFLNSRSSTRKEDIGEKMYHSS
jgi:hypothetical protein